MQLDVSPVDRISIFFFSSRRRHTRFDCDWSSDVCSSDLFMGRAPLSTLVGFNATINYSDIRADVPKIACPTLVITTDESGLASVEETRAWQETIRNSELLVIPGNSYHVAASDAERCARATVDFIARRGAT